MCIWSTVQLDPDEGAAELQSLLCLLVNSSSKWERLVWEVQIQQEVCIYQRRAPQESQLNTNLFTFISENLQEIVLWHSWMKNIQMANKLSFLSPISWESKWHENSRQIRGKMGNSEGEAGGSEGELGILLWIKDFKSYDENKIDKC